MGKQGDAGATTVDGSVARPEPRTTGWTRRFSQQYVALLVKNGKFLCVCGVDGELDIPNCQLCIAVFEPIQLLGGLPACRGCIFKPNAAPKARSHRSSVGSDDRVSV